MFNSFPKVALLGRPNVGKSTLFNRLIRSNRAITHDRPGVTRDRMEGIVHYRGKPTFTLIDTGGVTLESDSRVAKGPLELQGFENDILVQAQEAVLEATLLCLVVDAKDGLTPFDKHLADFLRKQNKPLLLIVNKIDGPETADLLTAEFHELGFPIMPVSASHGFNAREVETEILRLLRVLQKQDIKELVEELPENMSGATKRQKKRFLAEQAALLKQEALAKEETHQSENTHEDTFSEYTEIFDSDSVAYRNPDDLADGIADEFTNGQMDGSINALADALNEYDESPLDDESFDFSAPELQTEIEKEAQEVIDEVKKAFPELPFYSVDGPLRVALLGRPNAGKSSLVNALCGEKRMIVSDIAGTTRDSVDVTAVIDDEPCIFVDTAGVRRRAKVTDLVERYSVNSSLKSTTKAHVTLLVLSAEEGLTQQDKRLIELLDTRKTPFILLLNKIDLIPGKQRADLEKDLKHSLAFCDHVPILFISALQMRNLKRIIPLARAIRQECGVRVPTSRLNRAMQQVLDQHQPPIVRTARAKFFYLTQAEIAPPTFVFFVNSADRVLPSYARYLEKSLRRIFAIKHAPVRIHFRSSHVSKKRK